MTKKLAKKIEKKFSDLRKIRVPMTNPDQPMHGWTEKPWIAVYDRVTLELLARPVHIANDIYVNHATLQAMFKRCAESYSAEGKRKISFDKVNRYYFSYFKEHLSALFRKLNGSPNNWIIDVDRQAQVYDDLCKVDRFYRQLENHSVQKMIYTLLSYPVFNEETRQAKFYAKCFEEERAEKESLLLDYRSAYLPTEGGKSALIFQYEMMAFVMSGLMIGLMLLNNELQSALTREWDGSLPRYIFKLVVTEEVAWSPVLILALAPVVSAVLMFSLYHSRSDVFGLKKMPFESALKNNSRTWKPGEKKLEMQNMHAFFSVREMRKPNCSNVESVREAFKTLRQ